MANRNFDFLQVLGKGVKVVAGSFAPNGSSALDATAVKGVGFSVAYTSTGLYTITLNDTYQSLLAGHCDLQLNAADDKFAQLGVIDVVTAKTVQIRVWDISAAAVADVAANANNRIHFELYLSNTTVV